LIAGAIDLCQIEAVVIFKILHELIAIGDDAGLDHFAQQVVAFTRTLADAGKDRVAFAALGDVVMSSMMSTVLPTPAPAKEADLAARRNGWMRSITLIPVSNISSSVACSSNEGA